jgi:hypothetical protein
MRINKLTALKEQGLLSQEQFDRISGLLTGKVVSLFYELRIILYLGVMLFATGAGILIYQNIGDIGHIVSILLLSALSAACLYYAWHFSKGYEPGKVATPTPYYDYILLLGALLFVSVLTYLQVQYDIFNDGMGAATLATAVLFFYCAYRFDHLGVLSLAITSLASFFSISLSPQKWYSGNFLDDGNLHNTAIIFGALLATAAMVLDSRGIKKHFTFTYMNFAVLIVLTGSLAGMFDYKGSTLYTLPLAAGCAWAVYFGNRTRSFLFLLYAFVFGYIGLTYVLLDMLSDVFDDPGFWFFYLLLSCGAFIAFIIKYRKYFKR